MARQMSDGSLYAVTEKNSLSSRLLTSTSVLNAEVIDELYLPSEEDTTLQFQAFREAGYTEEMLSRIRLCLLKRPSGFVRYLDQETGNLTNVPGMQVWGLVFGIPRHTFTDDNPHYNFPWRFNAGTIMGTHAKNRRVNVKPIITQGAWLALIAPQFIVGSVSVKGWVSSCDMRNEVNFEYREHKQNRYWAQLMHSVALDDDYCAADGIANAPPVLTIWAQWADSYGSASAPMLGHVGVQRAIIEEFINDVFGTNISLPSNYPHIFSLVNGLLPDIPVRTGHIERRSHSARLMQIMFHELGHASHFMRAGN